MKITVGYLFFLGLISTACSQPYQIEQKEHAVSAYYQGKILWTYVHDPKEGKPFFHPLASTDGTVFTDLRPKDHPWHRGVWFSWKFINGVNYWEESVPAGKSDGETRIVRVHRTQTKNRSVQIELNITYGPAPGGDVVMKEERHLTVTAPDEAGCYQVDWQSTFEALDQDVLLDRTPLPDQPGGKHWGGYSGWSVRMNRAMRNGRFLNSHGALDEDRQPADWVIFTSPEGASLALMDHPQNLNYPAKWYLNADMPYFGPAVIHDAPFTLKAGEKLNLLYRLIVSPDELKPEEVRKNWRHWTGERH